MRFLIAPSENLMSIDNAVATIPGALFNLQSTISFAVWDAYSGGEYEFSDRPAMHEHFLDPSFAEAAFNLWLTAQTTAAPPLTLAQARAAKRNLVDGIYDARRQAPIAFLSWSWDADDESFAAMQAALASWDSHAAVNSAFTYETAQINAALTTVAAQVNAEAHQTSTSTSVSPSASTSLSGGSVSSTAGGITGMTSQPAGTTIAILPITSTFTPGSASTSVSAPASSSSVTTHSGIAATSLNDTGSISPPAISWPPSGSSSTIPLTSAQMRGLIAAIQTRRSSLNILRQTQKAQIAALPTIQSVVAYSINVAWPVSAFGTVIIPPFTAAGAALVRISATMSKTLDAFYIVSTASMPVTGSASPTLPAFTLTATAVDITRTSTLTRSIGNITATAAGYLAAWHTRAQAAAWDSYYPGTDTSTTWASGIPATNSAAFPPGTQIRVTLWGDFTFNKVYIGPRLASHPHSFDPASMVQLFFGGSAGASVTDPPGFLVSDPLVAAIDGTNGFCVKIHTLSGPRSNQIYTTSVQAGWTSYNKAGDDAATTVATGYLDNGVPVTGVFKIESFYP